MKKTLFIFPVFFITLVIIFFAISEPSKIIDPNNPEFDPIKFRFEDYPSETKSINDPTPFLIHEVYKKIFPVGTPKSYIDEILIGQAGAFSGKGDSNENSVVYRKYGHTNLSGWIVHVIYDEDFNLKNIKKGKRGYLYATEENQEKPL